MDLATLGLRIDSGQLRRGTQEINRFARSGRETSSVMSGMGRAVAGAFAAIGAGLGAANIVGTLRDFEAGMARVSAISGATETQLASLRDMAKDLGATTEFSASQAAGGMQFLAQAGFDAAETLEALPTVLDLATASSVDMATAADIASNILGGFGKSASDLSGVADVLAATTSRSNTNVTQLGDAMSYAGPLASAAGVSVEEAAAAVGKLSDAGIQGSRAGTTLAGVIRRLQAPTDKSAQVLADMGLTLEDVDLQGETLAEVMQLLADRNLTAAQAAAIFEAEAAPGALVMANNAAAMAEFTDELGRSQGSLAEMAATMRDTIDGSFRNLASATEGLIIELGDAGLTGSIQTVVDSMTGFVRSLSESDYLDEFLTAVGLVSAGLTALAVQAALVAFPFTTLAVAATAAAAAIAMNWETVREQFPGIARVVEGVGGAVQDALDVVKTGFGALAAFMQGDMERAELLFRAFKLDMQALALEFAADLRDGFDAAIEGATAALEGFEFSDSARQSIQDAVDGIEDLLGIEVADQAQVTAALDNIEGFIQAIPANIASTLNTARDALGAFIEALRPTETLQSFIGDVAEGVRSFAKGVGDLAAALGQFGSNQGGAKGFGAFMGENARYFTEIVGMGIRAVGLAMRTLGAGIRALVESDWSQLDEVRDELRAFFEDLVNIEVPDWVKFADTMLGFGVQRRLADELTERGGDLGKPFRDMGEGAEEAITSMEGLMSLTDQLIGREGLASSFTRPLEAYQQGIIDLDQAINRIESAGAATGYQEQADQIIEKLRELEGVADQTGASIEEMSGSFDALPGAVTTALEPLPAEMAQFATDGVTLYAASLTSGEGAAGTASGGVRSATLSPLSGLAAEMEQAGGNAIDGFAKGITDGVARAEEAAAAAVEDVIQATAAAQQSASPAKRVIPLGEDFAAGYAEGILMGEGGAGDAGASLYRAADDGLRGGDGGDTLSVTDQMRSDADLMRLNADVLRSLANTPVAAAVDVMDSTTPSPAGSPDPELAGRSIVEDVAAGMTNAMGTAIQAATDGTRGIMDSINSAVESAGPTKLEQVFDQVGDAFAAAIVKGEDFGQSMRRIFEQVAMDAISTGFSNLLSTVFGSVGSMLFGPGMTTGTPLAIPASGASALMPPSFDGGGFTGYGARSGGLDGKGGFHAMLHPRETVIDHTKPHPMQQAPQIKQEFYGPIRTEEETLPDGGRLQRFIVADVVNEGMNTRGGAANRSLAMRGATMPKVRR